MAHVQPVKVTKKDRKTGKETIVTKYRARWIDPDGIERCKTFPKRKQAQDHLDTIAAAIVTDTYIDPSAGELLFEKMAWQWHDAEGGQPGTVDRRASMLRNHILPVFGRRQLRTIRTLELKAFFTKLGTLRSPSTCRHAFQVLSGVLAAAILEKRIATHPMETLTRPKRKRSKLRIPTPAELARLIEHTPARYIALVMTAAADGTRLSEALGLTTDRLGLTEDRYLDIDRQLAVYEGVCFLKEPKSESGDRRLPFVGHLYDTLLLHLLAFPPTPVEIPIGSPTGPTETVKFVFTDDEGQPLTPSTFHRIWVKIRKAAGLEWLRFHDLRHYAISAQIRHGASVKEAQRFAGHSSASITLDTYSHEWPDSPERVAAASAKAVEFWAPGHSGIALIRAA